MAYKYPMYKVICSLLVCFLCASSYAQVQITVPTSPDTVICTGAPLTLHAINNGRNPITLTSNDFYSGDDGYSNSVIPIGFSYDFYGNTYTQCVISDNGFISFNTSNAGQFSDWELIGYPGLPGNSNSLNSVLGCYSDIL